MRKGTQCMGTDKIPYRNPEGYADPTAHDALASIVQAEEAADQRCILLIRVLKGAIELAGFELTERIIVRDKATGRVYR